MNKKFSIDIKTAKQLDEMRKTNQWSWKQLYAYYFGLGVERAEEVSPLDADALRKQVERKKSRDPHTELALSVGDSVEGVIPSSASISYTLSDDEVQTATGQITISKSEFGEDYLTVSDKVVKTLFEHFHLDPRKYELVNYKPTADPKGFKVSATFKRRPETVYDEQIVIKRYTDILNHIGSLAIPKVHQVGTENLLVINFADIHWNKMPHSGFDENYLANFEMMIYQALNEILDSAKKFDISRVAFTLAHDFFQTNDSRGGTKKGTPVSHILGYRDMFDIGARILATCVAMVGRHYMVDCYYVMANHDEDSGWHVSRELKLLFKDSPSINIIVDSMPFHYIEWGSTLVELKHANLKGGKAHSSMAVTAREAWGRTKYHYSVGGHLHGEYVTKEKDGLVAMGSRALSDTDEWHMLEGYVGNLRGIQAYVISSRGGLKATLNSNI